MFVSIDCIGCLGIYIKQLYLQIQNSTRFMLHIVIVDQNKKEKCGYNTVLVFSLKERKMIIINICSVLYGIIMILKVKQIYKKIAHFGCECDSY